MARAYSEDSTDVFRQKVTRKGVNLPSRWGYNRNPGDPYETVTFFGPYRTRNVGGEPWLNAGDTWMKVEVQKLEAVPDYTSSVDGVPRLEWVTEKEKVIEREGDQGSPSDAAPTGSR